MGTLKFVKVTVLLTDGEDLVSLKLDLPTATPALGGPVKAAINVAQGYGVQWVREALGVEPEVVDVSALRLAQAAKIG